MDNNIVTSDYKKYSNTELDDLVNKKSGCISNGTYQPDETQMAELERGLS